MNSRYTALFFQLTRFGIVGVLAAIVHTSVVISLVQWGKQPPLLANILGFASAFQLSYWGHRLFTFAARDIPHRISMSRLLFIQLINLTMNEALFFIFLQYQLPYILALILVQTILPVFTFISSKLWVFRRKEEIS